MVDSLALVMLFPSPVPVRGGPDKDALDGALGEVAQYPEVHGKFLQSEKEVADWLISLHLNRRLYLSSSGQGSWWFL